MRISGWHIDGYGHFCDETVRHVSPGMTVFLGPNEAGKSTLLQFLREMLFGLKRNPPLRGGRHGGQMWVEDSGGATYTIDRSLTNRKPMDRVLTAGGVELPVTDLGRLLGGCDAAAFASVFAFDLAELQSLQALTKPEITSRIFTTGITGAGASARDAIDIIVKAEETLLRKSTDRAILNGLASELATNAGKVKEAERLAGSYATVAQNVEWTRGAVIRIDETIKRANERRARAERLQKLATIARRVEGAKAEITEIERTAPPPIGEGALAALATLDQDVGRYRMLTGEEIPKARLEVEAAEGELSAQLRTLGPDWDRSRLVAFDGSIPTTDPAIAHRDSLAARRALVGREAEALRTEQQRYEEAVASHQRARETFESTPEPMPRAAIDAASVALGMLRGMVQEHETLRTNAQRSDDEVRHWEIQSNGQAGGGDTFAGWFAGAVLVVACLIGLAVWRAITGDHADSAALGIAALLAVAGAVAVRQRATATRERLRIARDAFVARRDELRARATADAGAVSRSEAAIVAKGALVGMTSVPGLVEIEDRLEQIRRASISRQGWDAEEARVAELAHIKTRRAEALEKAKASLELARGEEATALEAWTRWRTEAGIPATIQEPESVAHFLNAIELARERLGTLSRIERSLAANERWRDQFDVRVAELVATVESVNIGPADDKLEAITRLKQRASDQKARESTLEQWSKEERRGSAEMQNLLGDGPERESLLAEFRANRDRDWQTTISEVDAEIDSLKDERDRARDAANAAVQVHNEMRDASDLPALGLEREGLQARFDTAMREWRVLVLAKRLIEDTLTAYQRERQPEVLADASRIFGRITGDRYPSILQSESGIRLLDWCGTAIEPAALSRGTAEQLYLAVRLGLAGDIGRRAVPLPLIMDDVLVNFDPERASRVAEALTAFSQHHQVLLFSCHPETATLLCEADPGCVVYEMGPYGDGGKWRTPSDVATVVAA